MRFIQGPWDFLNLHILSIKFNIAFFIHKICISNKQLLKKKKNFIQKHQKKAKIFTLKASLEYGKI